MTVIRDRRKLGFRQIYVLCGADVVKLDIWSELAYRGIPYLDISALLEHVKTHNEIQVLQAPGEALLTVLKEVLHNAEIAPEKVRIVLNKSPEAPLRHDLGCSDAVVIKLWTYLKCVADGAGTDARVGEIREWILLQITQRTGLHRRVARRVFFLAFHVRDTFGRTGKFVVLLGPDGSGKTTLSQHLMGEVKARRGAQSRSLYLHGRFGILPNLGRLQGRNDRSSKMIFGYEERLSADHVHNRTRVAVYMLYYFWDYLLGYILLWGKTRLDTLVIADRYFYDYFLQDTYKDYPPFFRPLYLWLLPRPDVIVFLHADPSAIVERKPELSEAEIREQHRKVELLLSHRTFRGRSIIISTDTSQEETKLAVRKAVYS